MKTLPALALLSLATAPLPAFAEAEIDPPHPYTKDSRIPIVQKVQLLFSIVSHYSHIPDRVQFYNQEGEPRGNQNFAVPHLVYDPVITLYNPYPEPLSIPRLRIRIDDPPVGFQFSKISGGGRRGGTESYLRPEFASGEFHGLARLQIENLHNPQARRHFTLVLTDEGRGGSPGADLELAPGETKSFSPFIEDQWTWGLETSSSSNSRSFFDWRAAYNLGNEDPRFSDDRDPLGPFGVACVPGFDPRAGLQTDQLSYPGDDRPVQTLYDFELTNDHSPAWVAIRTADNLRVQSRVMRTAPDPDLPDFRIAVLAGERLDPARDRLQDFSFSIDPLIGSPGGETPTSRSYRSGGILQSSHDTTPGGKSPFALLTIAARQTPLLDGSLGKFAEMDGNRHYEVRFDDVATFSAPTMTDALYSIMPLDRPKVLSTARQENMLRIAFATPSDSSDDWRVMGGTSLDTLSTDLSHVTQIVSGPPGLGGNFARKLFIAWIDVSDLPSRYFARLEEQ